MSEEPKPDNAAWLMHRRLSTIYGKSANARGRINRAIRAELKGGEYLLYLLDIFAKIINRRTSSPPVKKLARKILADLNVLKDQMVDVLKDRYGSGEETIRTEYDPVWFSGADRIRAEIDAMLSGTELPYDVADIACMCRRKLAAFRDAAQGDIGNNCEEEK